MGVIYFLSLFLIGGGWKDQFRNMINILTLKDHTENIGVYYYISIEVFSDHIDFFLVAY